MIALRISYILFLASLPQETIAQKTSDPKPSFGIYLVKNSKNDLDGHVDMRDPQMYQDLILGSQDIISYKPDDHAFEITKNAMPKLVSARSMTFVVVVDGDVIYTGKIITSGLSVYILCPVIKIDEVEKTHVMKIYLGYPKQFQNLKDSRNDLRIISRLGSLGKIK